MNKLIVIASVIVATASADGGAGAYAGAMTVGTTAAHGAGTYAAHGAHGAMHGAHGLAGYGSTLGHMAAMGTAASFSGPLAVLGLLKIGAAAFMALNYFRAQNEREQYGYGYGYDQPHHYRHKRSVEEAAAETNPEAFFSLVNSMDAYGCGKQLVCELEAKSAYTQLDRDEALMVWMFGDRKAKKHEVNPASAKSEYDLAAELGFASKSQIMCRQRYATCPYSAQEMMDVLRSSQM